MQALAAYYGPLLARQRAVGAAACKLEQRWLAAPGAAAAASGSAKAGACWIR